MTAILNVINCDSNYSMEERFLEDLKGCFPKMKFKTPTFRTSSHHADFSIGFSPRFEKYGTSDYFLPAVTDSNVLINRYALETHPRILLFCILITALRLF